MKVNRRTFLRLLAPSLLLPGVSYRTDARQPSDALFIVVDGIGPTTPADRLRAFVEPFLEMDLPVGLILELPTGSEPTLPPELADQLRQIVADAPEKVEPVLSLPGLVRLPRYFQRRTTSDALQKMRDVFVGGAGVLPPSPVTIATDASAMASFDALRCLGIRNVLTLTPAQSVSSTGCADLTACLRGARRLAVVDEADPARWIETVFATPGWIMLDFSLVGIERASVQDARLRAQRACDTIGREIRSGNRFAALPREHARWFGGDQMRVVAVRVAPVSAETSEASAALGAGLRALGIAVTETVPMTMENAEPRLDRACSALSRPGQGQPILAEISRSAGLRCLSANDFAAAQSLRLETAIDLLLVPDVQPAFDERGLFIRGETDISEAASLLGKDHLMRDAILVVGPEDYATPHARQATLDTLREFQRDPGTKLVDVTTFFEATVAADPVFELLRDTHRDNADLDDPDALSSDEMLADARQAWAFFERFSIPATGLCIDTADVQGSDTWLHRELTMWDLGSLIAAVMAAHELGLIGDTDFLVRSELLVRALPVARIGEWLLPSEVISSDTGAALSDNFNACDTGRLLSVLRNLDAHPLTRGIAEETAARWDLDGVVVGGHVHSVVNGRLVDRFRSQCAHYTTRAFRARGINAASPFEITDAVSKTDREMLLLQALVGLDPLGAEPLLLEALEMGLSEPSQLLANVLSGAQRREHERSGTLMCLSEAPINREPWFTYQGLNVASSDERWTVNATSTDPRFRTPTFRRDTLLVNTKAAYLWLATRPCAYSTLLARYVRDRARLDGMGFSPGVFATTGQGMPGYVDINTNGIVLEAIAYVARGRMPRATL